MNDTELTDEIICQLLRDIAALTESMREWGETRSKGIKLLGLEVVSTPVAKMSTRWADDGDEISKRIRELRSERSERQHIWSAAEGVCATCKAKKDSFAATIQCPGQPESFA